MANRCYQTRAGAMYVLKHFVFIRKSSAFAVISILLVRVDVSWACHLDLSVIVNMPDIYF